ncbi:sulfatase-like hydrolase/transferase [Peribacillus asahii]|uniref:sulfatase-like hydrolase/transferase n=1 Tax=Peribacillus asahii TaxID=228899 RepID=UPI00382707E5
MEKNVGELLDYYKKLSKSIEFTLLEGQTEQAKSLIEEYNATIDNTDIYSQKAIYHVQKREFSEAIDVLEMGLIKHPFNYDVNYNMGFIQAEAGQWSEAIKYFIYAVKYSNSDENRQSATEQIQEIFNKVEKNKLFNKNKLLNDFNEYKKILQEADGRAYPMGKNGESLIRKVLKKENQNEYLINMYKSYSVDDINNSSRLFFKSELLKGNEVTNRTVLQLDYPSIIPISLISPQTKVEFQVNNERYTFQQNDLSHQKYHYIKIDEPGKITIKSNKSIFVGNPIQDKKEKLGKKLVLKIFIDGLSMEFLEKQGLKNLMPNTQRFFKDGFISKNCYGTSEWTLPCKASVNTGNYSTKHKLLHPNFNYPFEKYNKLMAEYFNEAGYFTTNICTNWRTTPSFGYYKGFDRIIYQNFLGGMDCKDVVMEVVEHLESFDFKNNFLSISMMDLHNVPDEIENHLMTEVNTELNYRVNTNNKGITSVQTKYDESKIYKYALEIKRIDIYLGMLFDYLTQKYEKDEIVVVLHSDHGQSFLENEESILHDSRIKIPLMVNGGNISKGSEDEIIEMIDILPIMMNVCDLKIPENIDGQLPKVFEGKEEREYSITQIIHPGQPYSAIIRDNQHSFYLETKGSVENDLSINIEEFESCLLEKNSKKDVSHLYKEKIEKYELIIFSHIKDFIRWSK